MGERAHDQEATGDDMARMSQLAEEGPRAGACGVSTSRTMLLSSKHGLVPGTDAAPEELPALDGMHLRAPEMVFDLPAGGRRLIQRADGYAATLVAGQVAMEQGQPTGVRPGGLVRF